MRILGVESTIMKKILYLLGVVFLTACSAGGGNFYQMSYEEKEAQRGYHQKEAKRIIDTNAKNKEANKKAAEKAKQEQNDMLNELNKNKPRSGVVNNRTFNFY